MTALDKLETVAASITALVVLGFLGAWDSKAAGTEQYRQTVKKTAYTLLGLPAQIGLTLIGITVGTVAWALRPTSDRVRKYSQWRSHKGAHRALAY